MKLYTSETGGSGVEVNRLLKSSRNFFEGKAVGRYLMKQDLMPLIEFYEAKISALENSIRAISR